MGSITISMPAKNFGHRSMPMSKFCCLICGGEQRPESLEQKWHRFFDDPSLWWDNRVKNWHGPDFRNVSTGEGLWIDSCPEWVCLKLKNLNTPDKGGKPKGQRAETKTSDKGTAKVGVLLSALKECRSPTDFQKVKMVHQAAIESSQISNIYVASSLVNTYAKYGCMSGARTVFDGMRRRDSVTWNALMFGYVDNGQGEAALELFACMEQEPDARSFVAAVKACTSLALKEEARKVDRKLVKVEALNKGMSIHSQALGNGHGGYMFLSNSLVDMYAKCGRMDKALEVFNKMESHGTVTWTALMFGYVENGDGEMALKLFMRMKSEGCAPNDVSFVAAFKACTVLAMKEDGKTIAGKIVKQASLEKGVVVHNQAVNSGYGSIIRVRNTLIDMYGKCGNTLEARKVFDATPNPNTVSWTAMILGYADNGFGDLAIELFKRMQREGCTPSVVTFKAVLKACSTVVAFQIGKDVHAAILDQGLENDNETATCLVDFYGKCGSMAEAQNVFDSLAKKNVVTWTALMAGYSRHGDTGRVFQLFEQMRSKGVNPDGVTFLCVLTACSHVGLIEQGRQYFEAMASEFQVKQERDHYTCMIDILGRANELKEAVSMVEEMPYEANFVTWMTVLGACRKWKNLEVARLAFDSLLRLDDKDASAYVLMENIYGSLNMWEEQLKIESMRLDARAWRVPGQSWWTDFAGMVHTFLAGDNSHPQNEKIRARLKQILAVMKEQGYKADLGSVVRDMPEQDKEDSLCGHSEKLAIACALINTKPGDTIRISKNLRVCNDCHTATAFISKIEKRSIICRDASRFHIFQNGICSCGDFW